MIRYKCSKCGREIGTRELGDGISLARFTIKAMPLGKGSGLYDKWICRDCDKDKVDNYIRLEGLVPRPWMLGSLD